MQVFSTRAELSALIAVGQHLVQKGYELTYLGVDSKGRLDLDELSDAMRKDTAIVSIMFANNETVTVFPIQKIAEKVGFKNHSAVVKRRKQIAEHFQKYVENE